MTPFFFFFSNQGNNRRTIHPQMVGYSLLCATRRENLIRFGLIKNALIRFLHFLPKRKYKYFSFPGRAWRPTNNGWLVFHAIQFCWWTATGPDWLGFCFFSFFFPVLQSRAVFRHQTAGWNRRSLADFNSSHRAVSLMSVKVLIPVCVVDGWVANVQIFHRAARVC